MAMDRPVNIQDKIDAIKKHYQLSPQKCRSAINKDGVLENEPNLMLACLLSGYKYVYLTSIDDFHNSMIPGLKVLLPELGIKQFTLNDEMILYSRLGERFGLLLAKLELQNALKAAQFPVQKRQKGLFHVIPQEHLPREYTSYLIGTLLGYSEPDIKYFYAVSEFINKNNLWSSLKMAEFPLWPAADQQAFNNFENNIWPRSHDYQKYLKDKNAAEQWINIHNDKTTEQLAQEVQQMQTQLFNLTKENTSRWIIADEDENSD